MSTPIPLTDLPWPLRLPRTDKAWAADRNAPRAVLRTDLRGRPICRIASLSQAGRLHFHPERIRAAIKDGALYRGTRWTWADEAGRNP